MTEHLAEIGQEWFLRRRGKTQCILGHCVLCTLCVHSNFKEKKIFEKLDDSSKWLDPLRKTLRVQLLSVDTC